LVVSVPPKIALSTFIGQVKGNSSRFVNHALGLEAQFSWQAEYGVLSFGGKALDEVVRCVRSQREHHMNGTVIMSLKRSMPDEATRLV